MVRIFQVKKVNIAVLKKVNVLLGAALVTLLTVTLAVYPKESVEAATATGVWTPNTWVVSSTRPA